MTTATIRASLASFYREFIMARGSFEPREFGIDMNKPEFLDMMVDQFNDRFRGQMSLDEVLLRPRVALAFCDEVRTKTGYFDLPDDIILRSVMQRRKGPST